MKSKVGINFIFSLGHSFLNVLIPFIVTPYVARVLGAENLGIYSYSYSVAYYFVIFAMLGINNYGNRAVATTRDDKEKLSQTFWEIYYLQLIIATLAFVIYILYAIFVSADKVASFVLVFYVFSAAIDIAWFFYGMENFKFIFVRNLAVKVITVLLVFLFVKSSNDVYLYALIMSVGFLVSNLFLWTAIKKHITFKPLNIKKSVQHLKPNVVLFIPVIAISIYNTMDKLMLGNLSNLTQVAFYDNAEKVMTIPQTIVATLGVVLLPKISNMIAVKKESQASDYLKKSLLFVAFISSACTFGIIAVANEFIHLYLGNEFKDCVELLYWLMPCLIFKAYANVFRMQYIIPRKKDTIYVISVCLGAVINFVFNIVLIPRYQAVGACIGTILAEIIVCLYQMAYVLKHERIGMTILKGFVFQIAGIIMCACVNVIPFSGNEFWVLLYKVVIGALIYLLLSLGYILLLRWYAERMAISKE